MVFSRLLAGDKTNVIYRTNAYTSDYNSVKGIRKAEKTVAEMEEDSKKYRELAAAAAKENVK